MSYLVDTNVLSELRKGSRANAKVRTWFESIGDAELYLSTDPEHVAFRISPGGHSERLDLPWAFYESPVSHEPQIPWGIRHVELDGKTHICAAHGFDDPLSQDVRRIGSETVNCYARDEAGTWSEKTDPVLNRVGTVANAGQYRFLHATLSADGTQWMVVAAIVGFGDRSARFLYYREAGR